MTDAANQKYDLAIIGTGMAGMAAAVFAVNRGISTAIVGSLGESWFTGGLIDLMGVHPISNGKTWRDPWAAIKAVAEDIPGHPYARLSEADIIAALRELFDFLNGAGVPYCCKKEQNSNLITAFGSIKTTHGVPRTMRHGVTALSQKSPCLIVDIKGLRGFSARLITERLKPVWPSLHPLSIQSIYDGQSIEINSIPFANDLEIPAYREKLADLIRPHAKDVEFIGVPALLGINQADSIVDEIANLIGKPVFEIPTMPPSIPGIRLKEAFIRSLSVKRIRCMFQKQVLQAEQTTDNEFMLKIGKTDHEATIISNGIVLASGRFLGGGLQTDQTSIKETLFNLPVYQPSHRKNWHADHFFISAGHAINHAGIETDSMLRPLAENGRPAFEKLFVAGTLLAHQDWTRMKCGSGLSIATAYGAVESFLKMK